MRLYPLLGFVLAGLVGASSSAAQTYSVVDTGQTTFYDDQAVITAPSSGDPFYGQDAQHTGHAPSYTLSGDGLTVLDNVTGLTWTSDPDLDGDGDIDASDKLSWTNAGAYAGTLNAQSYGGHDDWRLPSIKELYSLIVFSGIDVSGYTGTDTSGLTPFIDTSYFEFGYGDTNAGERIIDAQYWTSTEYVSTTMNGDDTVFGVNFADGRIKGYPKIQPQSGSDKLEYVRYVRGNTAYGINDFADNGDGTVTDDATGLMWSQNDSGTGMDWEAALAWVAQRNTESHLGHDDWRLPHAKELQSILDYTRSPDTTASAAIDPVFNTTAIVDEGGGTDYPFYWTGTTHANMGVTPGEWAAYVCFGECLGYMEQPPLSGLYVLLDVHGAGSQRSDPKSGDPANWPNGNGPQGDVVRIDNYVRLVRNADSVPPATPTPTSTALETPVPTCTPAPPDPTPVPLSAGGVTCQRTIAKETTKFVKAKVKALQKCHEALLKDKTGPDPGSGGGGRLAFCLTDAKTAAKIAKASSKIGAKIAKACGGSDRTCGTADPGEETPDTLGYYGTCPNFESSALPECSATISNCDDIADCIECIGEAAVDQALLLYYDQLVDTDPIVQKTLNKCQLAIGKEAGKFLLAKEKNLGKCWDAALKGKHQDACPNDAAAPGSVARKTAEKIGKAESKKIVKICKACGGDDRDCDQAVTPVNPLTPVLGGTLTGDDFTPGQIGFPANCNDVKVPGGGPFCDIAVATLADLIYCVDCVTEFKVDCVDAARVPELQGRVYPCECNP